MVSKRHLGLLALISLCFFAFVALCQNVFAAPLGCSPGFRHWFFHGDVTVDYHAQAVLGDNGVAWSYLYAFYEAGPGIYQVDFDFKNELAPLSSPSKPPYVFPDSFYASIFLRDDPLSGECSDCYELIELLDMDAGGVFRNHGTIGESILGEEWLHFSMVFENQHQYIRPVFELFDGDWISNDSHVYVSNICISQVPAPGSLLLLGSGLVWLIRRRHRFPAPRSPRLRAMRG